MMGLGLSISGPKQLGRARLLLLSEDPVDGMIAAGETNAVGIVVNWMYLGCILQ